MKTLPIPCDIDLERIILGALLISKDNVNSGMHLLKNEIFFDQINRTVFESIFKLFNDSEDINLITVVENLSKRNKLEYVGGAYFVATLTSNVVMSGNIGYYIKILIDLYMRREFINVINEYTSKGHDKSIDVSDLIGNCSTKLLSITKGINENKEKNIFDIAYANYSKIRKAYDNEYESYGIMTGLNEVDSNTMGLHNSDLTIIAARPSMGKTALITQLATNIAKQDIPIAIFSLEMSAEQLEMRMKAQVSEIDSEKLKKGKLTQSELDHIANITAEIANYKIFIEDNPNINIINLRIKTLELVRKHGIKIIIIDYLQLMSAANKKQNREAEISEISRGLKCMAKEMDIPVITLSQLNRSVETRQGEKKPKLSDLRESGAIEQDADNVWFIHRPFRMGITQDELGNCTREYAELLIAKQRNGALAEIPLRFVEDKMKFYDAEYESDMFF